MNHTVLSPTIFMELWIGMIVGVPLHSGEPVTLIGEGKRRHSFVSVDDVAAFETYDSAIDMSEFAPAYGVDLTPVEVCLRRMFAA